MTRVIATLVAGLVMLAMPLAAHEGHGHKTMGVVSSIHENQLEVTDAKAQKKTFTLDQRTKILRGKTALRLAEIKVGERVVVTYEQLKDKAGKMSEVVKTVQLGITPVTTKTAGSQ